MIWYLWEKWDIYVHRSIVFRLLKRREWSNKSARRIDLQNEELRQHWIADLLDLTAKQLVFVDEFLFNEITDWRLRAYALIDQSAWYRASIRRDRVWSVLSAYTSNDKCFFHLIAFKCSHLWMTEIEMLFVCLLTNWFADYLLCTGIKENYYNLDSFQHWITNDLLSHCNVYSTSRSVIIMNNASAHCNLRIRDVIETYDCRVKYLPSYSSDYNLIELSFSILKAWMRRHFHESWPHFDEIFEDFLRYAVNRSQCDRFAKQHFKHSAEMRRGIYISERYWCIEWTIA
jgi:hypothetical protein